MDKLKPEWKAMANDLVVYRPILDVDVLHRALGQIQGLLDSRVIVNEAGSMPAVQIIGRAFSDLTRSDAQKVVEQELATMKIDGVRVDNRIEKQECDFDIELIYLEMGQKSAEKIGVDLLNALGLNMGFETSRTKGTASWPWSYEANFKVEKVLDFIKNNDDNVTLARQMVSVSNGATASSTLGGTITLRPQPTDGTATTAAREVPYGFSIQVTPSLISERRVRLEIKDSGNTETKVYKSGQDDIEVTGATLSTVVTLEEGKQRTLNSMERRYVVRSHSGVPILKDIPLIGLLFGRYEENSMNQRAALIVVVRAKAADATPIFAPLEDSTDVVIEEIKRRLNSPDAIQP